MTQEESKVHTKRILRSAKTPDERSQALMAHFKIILAQRGETNKTPINDALDVLNSPLFGFNS